MAKSDKKVEKKSVKPAKPDVKPKSGKKVVEKHVASAKHSAPISSKEILARVCFLLASIFPLSVYISFLIYIYIYLCRSSERMAQKARRRVNLTKNHRSRLLKMTSRRTGH